MGAPENRYSPGVKRLTYGVIRDTDIKYLSYSCVAVFPNYNMGVNQGILDRQQY